MDRVPREGLAWEKRAPDWDQSSSQQLFSHHSPRWIIEPRLEAIEAVCRQTLKLRSEDRCTVEFFSAGSFNRLYLVVIPSLEKRLLMRASLPVDPYHKTMGEVATIYWIRHFTNIPVPEIIACDPTADNEIGFEWILMPLIAGTTASSAWRKMSMTAKEEFVRQVADFQAQILNSSENSSQLKGVGTLTFPDGIPQGTDPSRLVPGQLVSRHFFVGDHYGYDVYRGPFHSSREWLDPHIRIIIESGNAKILSNQDKDDVLDKLERQLRIAKRLLKHLPTVFPGTKLQEPTVISHGDLSLRNILVDEKGVITAVLDWEFASAVPYWRATQMPRFLVGHKREVEPRRELYLDEDQGEGLIRHPRTDGNEILDNEGKNGFYWAHLMEYDQTLLRKTYTERMRQLRPMWDAEAAGKLKNDFMEAVDRCADFDSLETVERWVAAVENGENPRLA